MKIVSQHFLATHKSAGKKYSSKKHFDVSVETLPYQLHVQLTDEGAGLMVATYLSVEETSPSINLMLNLHNDVAGVRFECVPIPSVAEKINAGFICALPCHSRIIPAVQAVTDDAIQKTREVMNYILNAYDYPDKPSFSEEQWRQLAQETHKQVAVFLSQSQIGGSTQRLIE